MKRILYYLSIQLLIPVVSFSQEFKIIAHSDNRITTHKLSSGTSGFEIGITSNGGGVINYVNLPGKGDIMKLASDRYGRAGQLAFRDASHGGSYNPTQAGYNEDLGTKCQVVREGKKLIIPQRGMALWFGDNRYDFSEWENIGDDSKDSDGGNSDKDGLDESNLPGKQETEVHSEFDYYGTYEDVYGQNGIDVGVIRHYFEASFIREPGHCINQFREGTPMFNGNALRNEIKRLAPSGSYPGTEKDLNGVIAVWSLRNDVSKWDYDHVYFRNSNGDWQSFEADVSVPASYDQSIMIMAESANPNTGRALCLYRPETEINTLSVVGIDERFGTISYKDDRIRLAAEGTKITYDKYRAPAMSKYGFSNRFSGMINRTRLGQNEYEMYRGEYYIIYGTPQQIMDNIDNIDGLKISQNISFAELEDKKVGDADFYPKAYSDSRLPIQYTSSNPAVAKIVDGKIVLVGAGTTTITASQSGNATYKTANPVERELTVTSDGINLLPSVTIDEPLDGSIYFVGDEILMKATASDEDGSIEKVNFKVNNAFYKQDRTRPYSATFTPTEAGTYILGARAFDNTNAATEESVTVEVKLVTGVETNFNSNQVDVYPNPSESGVFHLHADQSWRVYDLHGSLIQSGSEELIDLSNQSKGIYFLKVEGAVKQLILN